MLDAGTSREHNFWLGGRIGLKFYRELCLKDVTTVPIDPLDRTSSRNFFGAKFLHLRPQNGISVFFPILSTFVIDNFFLF